MDYIKKSFKVHKGLILFWTIFIGIGAVAGSIAFFLDPHGEWFLPGMLEVMQEKLPLGNVLFTNYYFSGVSLFIVNGITNIIAFILILKNKRIGYILGYVFGITLMLWICIQFYVFAPTIYTIDIVYFLFGLNQAIFGYYAYVEFEELNFKFSIDEYKNIQKDSKTLVVYFSRTGYTKKLAYEKANELGSEILEIKTKERTHGYLGFWWCGRFGMHKWEMPIDEINIDFSKYEKIFIYSPTWVFRICGPIRAFLNNKNNELTNVYFNIVHFMNIKIKGAQKEVKNILKDNLKDYSDYSCHFGKTKKLK